MKPLLQGSLSCPACQAALQPKVWVCGHCDLRVEGSFAFNEFATLSAEDLHLLRIFVLSEGRIREMESPLGLSYPTIRARLKALREKISAAPSPAPAPKPASVTPKVATILQRLEAGELSFDEAMALMKKK